MSMLKDIKEEMVKVMKEAGKSISAPVAKDKINAAGKAINVYKVQLAAMVAQQEAARRAGITAPIPYDEDIMKSAPELFYHPASASQRLSGEKEKVTK